MKKFIKVRFLSFVCAFSILISICAVPALAASGVGADASLDIESRDSWAVYVQNADTRPIDVLASYFGLDTGVSSVFFRIVTGVIGQDFGEVELSDLNRIAAQLNAWFGQAEISDLYDFIDVGSVFAHWTLAACFGLPNVDFQVVKDSPTAGYYRIQDTISGLYIVNDRGNYPCTPHDGEFSEVGGNQWIGEVTASDRISGEVAIQTLDRLNLMCHQLKAAGIPAQIRSLGSNYKCIWYNRQVYADANGIPYVAWVDPNQSATNQERPDTGVTVDGENVDVIEGNQTNIDLSGMTITLPDGSVNLIDKIIYDESTKSYHIDSHDTYNYTINNYYTWNYYINYTSITYIGQTEEYNKYYEVYYELPDGRDSADLTKEDLEQLNVSVDVIPYGRSADDTSLRSLYHFDGDTRDSSYWNYCTGFTWNKGASLTYMDAGVFDGALYLDETEHDFTLTLPSNITSGDFTLQFRYYQSATAAPQTDSYISLDTTSVFKFDGSSFKNNVGTFLASTPVGTWNEIALIRDSGTLYYYLNGICIGSIPSARFYGNSITFHFGAEQQTYKYLDELRVLNYALQTGGTNYECTSVPHDTNLTLVLPDSAVPVADEYWSILSSGTNLLQGDFTTGNISNVEEFDFSTDGYLTSTATQLNVFYYDSDFTHVSVGSDGLIVDSYNSSSYYRDTSPIQWARGLLIGFGYYSAPAISAGTYTLSVVLSDGNVYSFSFASDATQSTSVSFDWGTMGYYVGNPSSAKYRSFTAYIDSYSGGNPIEIVYIELIAGTETDLTAEKITSVTAIDKEDLNTPTLAVRTDLDITSYQIGGVRPSLPEKGQVWALVENERITSIQIYNGQAWEACDGRIWTGERWIPASSYNIITLQDMYDIVDATQDYEYIYSESGFWSWWQKSWNAFTEKLFSLLGSGVGGTGSGGCDHPYTVTVITQETCTDAGLWKYSCPSCGHEYLEQIAPLGHDWLLTESSEDTYALPDGVSCPDCGSNAFTSTLDAESALYTCTCSVCEVSWSVNAEITEGEKLYTCSRCGATTHDITGAEKDSWSFLDLLVALKDGTWKIITGVVSTAYDGFSGFVGSVSDIGGFFDTYKKDGDNSIWLIPLEEGATVWD